MTVLLGPSDYGWSAPVVITDVRDEPDDASARALAIYDYSVGRLGSDITLHVAGSDDSTVHRLVVRTQLALRLTEQQKVIGAIIVTPTYRCQEVQPEIISEDEEYGVSRVTFDWISRPYALIEGQIHGIPLPVPDLHAAHATGADGLFSGGKIDKSQSFGLLPKSGQDQQPRFTFTDVVAADALVIFVGLETEVRAYSNDWTYEIRLRSHWLVPTIEVSGA